MANWTNLKTAIAEAITTNGNQEITGVVLQNTLGAIVNTVGENAAFIGVATPATNPGVPDGPVFYLAGISGAYSNFGVTIQDEIAVIANNSNGSWVKSTVLGAATTEKPGVMSAEDKTKLTELGSEIAQSFVETFTVSPSTSVTRLSVTNPKSLQNGGKIKVEINDSELPCEVYIMYKDNTASSLVPNQWNVVYIPSNKEFSYIRVSILANSITEIKDVNIKVSVVGENFANFVSEDFAEEKNLTDAEKETVRKNIDAAYSGDLIMPYIKSQKITNVTLSTSIEVTNIPIYDGISVKPEVVSTDIIPTVYVIYSDNSNSSLSYGEWNTITIPSGKSVKSIRFYYKKDSFTEQTSVTVKVTTVTQQLNTIISSIASNKINGGGLPKIKLLVLGDSYSVNGGQWIKPLINELPTGSTWKSLAVGSASLKDKYSDRTTYPYTSRPVQTNTNGNNNTFACQIEKLKRLMNGTDLDSGESAIYQNEEEYPNVIIIEGGHNDSQDENTDNYYEQLEKVVSGYAKRTSGATLENRNVCIKTPLEEVNRTCFAGAYRYLIDELFQIFPNAQIYITTCSSISYKQNPVAKKRQTIAEQQRLCADMYAINVIDWHNKGQVSPITNYATGSGTESDPYIWGEFNGEYADTNDHLHINARGGKKYARCAALAIKDSFLNIGIGESSLTQ